MFSRLARPINNRIFVRKLLPSLSSSNKVFNLGPIRFDSTLTKNYEHFEKQMNDANVKALKARDEGIVGQFGWIPFYGMVGVICLSKEIVIAGTESMLMFCFLTWAFSSYILAGETVTKTITQLLADNKTKFDKLSDWHIERLRVHKATTEVDVETVPVLVEMLKQQREVEKEWITAQNMQQRHELRQAIVDKLTQIKVREDSEAAREQSLLIDSATANVYKAFAEDKGPLREAALVNAISLLGTDGSTTIENDPVKQQFVKELQ